MAILLRLFRRFEHHNHIDMTRKQYQTSFALLITFLCSLSLWAQPINDHCSGAIDISDFQVNSGYSFYNGTTTDAEPESINGSCGIGDFPTVWYKFDLEQDMYLNIHVKSSTIFSPAISLYANTCSTLLPIQLSNFENCASGSNGSLLSLNTRAQKNTRYFLAVTSNASLPGDFVLSINGIEGGSKCIERGSVEVIDRSGEGSLAGPFKPGETIRVSMNVDNFSGAKNNCQWFQGLVPSFGNGWDPLSFDANGQPLNARLNDKLFDGTSNGQYGPTIWEWLDNVDYHYDNPRLIVDDFDGNGRLDICNNFFDPDCQATNYVKGSCCGPCWDKEPGTVLPAGWFAYGIAGSCVTSGPPVGVDWGDGAHCGNMGKWHFTFDLKVREQEELEMGLDKLSIGFHGFSDGQTGAWVGEESICALDAPIIKEYDLEIRHLGVDTTTIQSDIIWKYPIESGSNLTWTAIDLPYGVELVNRWTPGGQEIQFQISPNAQLEYYTTVRLLAIPVFGRPSTFDVVFPSCKVRDFEFPDTITICLNSVKPITLRPPFNIAGGTIEWLPGHQTTPYLTIPIGSALTEVSVLYTDAFGCQSTDNIVLQRKYCATITDKDNPGPGPTDPNPFDSGLAQRNLDVQEGMRLVVFPNPAQEQIYIDWGAELSSPARITVYDINGAILMNRDLGKGHDRRITLPTESFIPGTYHVSFTQADKNLVTRFVKL